METTFHKLASQLNLTDLEPYVLTAEEEKEAVDYAIEQAKKHKAWRLSQMNLNEHQIFDRILKTNWEEKINRDNILLIANSNKQRKIWNEKRDIEEREMNKKRQMELQERCNAKYILSLMKETSLSNYNRKLIINESNKVLITALCYFFSNDERFESELNYSFRKGILIRGVSGLGKTYLMKCIEKNELHPITTLSMIEISETIRSEGEFSTSFNGVVYLDDVGTEEATINYFGTKINYFKNFIEVFYLKNQGVGFSNLIISTNNSFSEIEEKYGFRVRSRMKEMFNIIDISGNDMRK